ncbi:MAG: hypothetical protein CMN77_11590 [Spirochaetaceae bacterium]|nr:hypothetical protein [Spirochaetaceae bacterium]|tara:strand:+ start:82971 stop:84068 length:1098 start_codon:yes stop_codon:yes gene_type:complete
MQVISSAPGRICLFGEHQDYLGLPVIAMAVNLRFYIEYEPAPGSTYRIQTPDLQEKERSLDIESGTPASSDDFCWGIAQVLKEEGFKLPAGGVFKFHSGIPVRAGCSSSSAMSAAWLRLLIEIGDHPEKDRYINDPVLCAQLVYRGEKEKFQGAGGMMDQYTCYIGGLLHVYPELEGGLPFGVERLKHEPREILLVDSGDPKDTQGVLSSASGTAQHFMREATESIPEFSLSHSTLTYFDLFGGRLRDDRARVHVRNQLRNRDICQDALRLLRNGTMQSEILGTLFREEHEILAGTVGISTLKIDAHLGALRAAGSPGGKINGSGGGGTFFCVQGKEPEKLKEYLEKRELRYFPVHSEPGARIES